jgi:hypothetical protein
MYNIVIVIAFRPTWSELFIRAKLADCKFASRQSASFVPIKRGKLGSSLL